MLPVVENRVADAEGRIAELTLHVTPAALELSVRTPETADALVGPDRTTLPRKPMMQVREGQTYAARSRSADAR